MTSEAKRRFQTPHVISDLPLRHGDQAHFHFDEFAVTLARLIADQSTRTPLTIGVSRQWGSGKTTLLKRIQKILDEPIDPQTNKHRFANDAAEAKRFRPCKTVWFDAWKYDDETELLVALVRVILNTMDAGNLREKFWKEWIDPIQPGYDFVAMFLNAFKLKFGGVEVQLDPDKYKVETEFQTHAAFFDYFDEAFEMLLARWVHNQGDYRQIDEKRGALVVFIDDLDRCLPDKAVQVLEAVKLFMDKPGCVFVLGADVDQIQQAVASHYKEFSEQEAGDYLEKVIQLRFRLPPIASEAMQAYLQTQAEPGVTGKNQAVLARWQALAAAAEANPRRVKTVINDLNLQWYMLQNSGQAQGVNRDDFICWQALMRAAPAGFRKAFFGISEDELGLRLRYDFIQEALKWMCGSEEEKNAIKDRFREYTGSDARRLRDVLQQIGRFSDEFTPSTLHAHVHLIAPPPMSVVVELEAAKVSVTAGMPTVDLGQLEAAELIEERTAQKAVQERPGKPSEGAQTWGKLEFIPVPQGAFAMGSPEDNSLADDDEKPRHNVDIPHDYWVARYPLTNARFEEFVQAKPYRTTAEEAGSGYAWDGKKWKGIKGADWRHPRGPKSSLKGKEDHPVVQVSWLDAMAYCRWMNEQFGSELPDGCIFRLPTEAEWEKAARGPYGNEWPWGNEFDPGKCNSREGGKGDTTPVGAYSRQGDSPYGAADMVGNVWEWTHTKWEKYPYQAEDGREREDESSLRVLRGGSFYNDRGGACCASRGWVPPYDRLDYAGFRVVVSPILNSAL